MKHDPDGMMEVMADELKLQETLREDEVWSHCKCGEEKEGYPDVHDICPSCKRTGCFMLDEE